MDIVVRPNALAAAHAAAYRVADEIAGAVSLRGRATIAFSGGSTPRLMFEHLAELPLPWRQVQVFQVDERAVPSEDLARNWTSLQPLTRLVPPTNQHPMPVEIAEADALYGHELDNVLGRPPVFDVVHLGLGDDGHTASLVPGDPILDVVDEDVGWVDSYRGHRRLSLTIPALSRARTQVWLVCGEEKAKAVGDVIDDRSLTPASLVVNRPAATLILDVAAARLVSVA